MTIAYEAPYYKIVRRETLKSIEVYKQFINWTIGEFDLNLIEESDGLIVYFPNGLFTIKSVDSEFLNIIMEIKIETKVRRSGVVIANKIMFLLNHAKKFN